MQFYQLLATALTLFPPVIVAQSASATITSASPSQSAEFASAVEAYAASLAGSPAATSLGLALVLNGHADAIQSITQNIQQFVPTSTSLDMYSFATDPPTVFSTLPWESDLPTNLQQDIKSIQTSAVLHIASLDQSVLGISVPLATQTQSQTAQGAAQRQTAAAGMLGAAGLAVGAAAALL